MSKNQDGGKLLGYGSYGCVLKPNVKCKDKTEKKMKIQMY